MTRGLSPEETSALLERLIDESDVVWGVAQDKRSPDGARLYLIVVSGVGLLLTGYLVSNLRSHSQRIYMTSLEKVWLTIVLLAFAIAHIWGASLMPISDNGQEPAVMDTIKIGD